MEDTMMDVTTNVETNVAMEKRLPYVREEMSRLVALVEKLDARAGDLSERLAPVLANRPPLYDSLASKVAPSPPPLTGTGTPDDMPSLAQELRVVSDGIEKVMLRLEDTQSRVEV